MKVSNKKRVLNQYVFLIWFQKNKLLTTSLSQSAIASMMSHTHFLKVFAEVLAVRASVWFLLYLFKKRRHHKRCSFFTKLPCSRRRSGQISPQTIAQWIQWTPKHSRNARFCCWMDDSVGMLVILRPAYRKNSSVVACMPALYLFLFYWIESECGSRASRESFEGREGRQWRWNKKWNYKLFNANIKTTKTITKKLLKFA